jgi:nucleotide-binding universal stress UspA family protein
MKTILVPTDFSEASENAVNYAAELAKFIHAKLIIFHGYTIPVPVSEAPVVIYSFEELEKANMQLLTALNKKIKANYSTLETELITRPGFPIDEIIRIESQKKVDFVVMGLSGAGRTKALLGSNTTSVMKKSPRPVIIVPYEAKFKKPGKMALACDYTAIVPDHVISSFKEFVKLFGSKVLVFDVLRKAELVTYEKATAEVNLENSLGDIEHSLYFPSGDNLAEEVNEFVDRNNVDMLTVMPHNHSFFSGLFHHSSAKKIALHTHVPILSIHE